MEDYVILLSIMMFGIFALIGAKMFKPSDNRKKAKLDATDSAQKEVISSKDITITTLKDELRSLNGKMTRLRDKEPEYEEELTEDSGKQVTWEEIQSLVKVSYPKYAPMLPLLKKQIMDATKGMSMAEILDYVKQFTGNKESQGGASIESTAYNPNWA